MQNNERMPVRATDRVRGGGRGLTFVAEDVALLHMLADICDAAAMSTEWSQCLCLYGLRTP
jgi:electron transfer flavoprotein alpha subunit